MSWETVGVIDEGAGATTVVDRLAVDGGYLYRVRMSDGRMSVTFVPSRS